MAFRADRIELPSTTEVGLNEVGLSRKPNESMASGKYAVCVKGEIPLNMADRMSVVHAEAIMQARDKSRSSDNNDQPDRSRGNCTGSTGQSTPS